MTNFRVGCYEVRPVDPNMLPPEQREAARTMLSQWLIIAHHAKGDKHPAADRNGEQVVGMIFTHDAACATAIGAVMVQAEITGDETMMDEARAALRLLLGKV